MNDSQKAKPITRLEKDRASVKMQDIQNDYLTSGQANIADSTGKPHASTLSVIGFLEDFNGEVDTALGNTSPNPYMNMTAFLIRNHLEGKTVTPSALIAAAGVPYATGRRKLTELIEARSIEQRPRTKTGKSFSLHPSEGLLESWRKFADRVRRLAGQHLGSGTMANPTKDYYFGDSYMAGQSIKPPRVLPEPLALPGGLRILVHGDPTFMVMENLKRQFEQVIGTHINQRAFSIDRLHEEILRNAERPTSRYDIIAVDLPWIGELAEKNILLPLDEILDIERLDPADFHTAGWQSARIGAVVPTAFPARQRRSCCSIAKIGSQKQGWSHRRRHRTFWTRPALCTTHHAGDMASPGMLRAALRLGISS